MGGKCNWKLTSSWKLHSQVKCLVRFYRPCTMWWYSWAYMVKLIFHYQHKNVAGQNRLELHNMLDHILFRWRRGKYLISAWNEIEQNKWLSSNKEITLPGYFFLFCCMNGMITKFMTRWWFSPLQNSDKKIKLFLWGQTETSEPAAVQSQSLNNYSVSSGIIQEFRVSASQLVYF